VRLDERGWWPEEGILQTLGLSQQMLNHCKQMVPPIAVIETSVFSVNEVASQIKTWILSIWDKETK
jgi:hypothetical protein